MSEKLEKIVKKLKKFYEIEFKETDTDFTITLLNLSEYKALMAHNPLYDLVFEEYGMGGMLRMNYKKNKLIFQYEPKI